MLARRLQVARLLMNGYTYEDIEKEMKVINTTIAKVQTWLNLYGDGYRTIVERTKIRLWQRTRSRYLGLKSKEISHVFLAGVITKRGC